MGTNKYENYTDEELIEKLNKGEKEVTDYLCNKYKGLVRKKAHTMFILGGDNDDLIQEGMIGLYKAIRDYEPEHNIEFSKFASLCISRQIYTAINASQRLKHKPLNSYISLNSDVIKDGDNPLILKDSLMDYQNQNPEELFIDKENTDMIKYEIVRCLSPYELKVLNLYISGNSYTDIAEILGKTPKSVDNALSRIKNKISNVLM